MGRAVIPRIVSGGQTGADRAALDFALARHLPHGGWCPRGRRAEDGPLAPRYQLQETPGDAPAQRTRWNVRDSDGTVILSLTLQLAGGSALTTACARQLGRPLLHLTPAVARPAQRLREFVAANRIGVLNVAGPRASEEPAVGRFVAQVLAGAFPARAKDRRRPGPRPTRPSRRGGESGRAPGSFPPGLRDE